MSPERDPLGPRGMEIRRFETEEEARREAGAHLDSLLARYADRPILLLTSGGTSHALLEFVPANALGPHVTVSTLDERYSEFDDVNNFAQLMHTGFYSRAAGAGARFFDTRVHPGESFADFTRRLDDALHAWRDSSKGGVVLATIGIGRDGHVAGMMGYPEDPARFADMFEDPRHWVRGYDAGGKNLHPLRVTVTMPFLRSEVRGAVIFAAGEAKRAALEAARAPAGTLAATPARIIREMRDATICTDIRP